MKIYLIGSLRNPKVPEIAKELRFRGYGVVDDWYSAGPDADTAWREYEVNNREHSFPAALRGIHAEHVFAIDKKWIDWADVGILVCPAGRSGHLELGYMLGRGKVGIILLEEPNPARWDIMYNFADLVTSNLDAVPDFLEKR